MATSTQNLAVALAFLAAVLSLGGAAVAYARTGAIRFTLLVGGVAMLALAMNGYKRLRRPRR